MNNISKTFNKKTLIGIFFILGAINCYTQTFGSKNIILSTDQIIQNVSAADLDGDGDMDVLAATSDIGWFENTDGNGSFGDFQLIVEGVGQSFSNVITDVDDDGDNDIVASSFDNFTVFWLENTDGLGSFGIPQLIGMNPSGPTYVNVADLDGDNDIDVLVGYNLDRVVWHENTDGNGTFGSERNISNTAVTGRSVQTADLDLDGDLDAICSSLGSVTVSWFENTDGMGNFSNSQPIVSSADGVVTISVTDLNNDDIPDIITGMPVSNRIEWYENLDGSGDFGTLQLITDQANFVRTIVSGDIDNDGDQDIVSASSADDKIAWYKNEDGLGTFGSQLIIDGNLDNPRTVFAGDLDGDGDLDILSGSRGGGNNKPTQLLVWYENLTILGVPDLNADNFIFYPNPVDDVLFIQSKIETIETVSIYTVGGRLIREQSVQNNSISMKGLASGLYFINLSSPNGEITKKVIKQ